MRAPITERPCWLAELPVSALHAAAFGKLVILGGWESEPPGYRPGMAAVMRAVCTSVADRIGARLAEVPGTRHEPHREQPEAFNHPLSTFWSKHEAP
ncbi:hypothetical protein M1L60_41205 [Actinoplanes sp. TRM 88003]|uniref:Uncharacterized protein n=1 Tax=Paractinoplanes aksuensis TaxID=2939490 RepID=A0ABT1E5D4_9ACTN|nr:hypothetical protein [Actinoplanes aksuensis]MCO8277016.1 hypothetical protein [Actinoplanes aksuensis]